MAKRLHTIPRVQSVDRFGAKQTKDLLHDETQSTVSNLLAAAIENGGIITIATDRQLQPDGSYETVGVFVQCDTMAPTERPRPGEAGYESVVAAEGQAVSDMLLENDGEFAGDFEFGPDDDLDEPEVGPEEIPTGLADLNGDPIETEPAVGLPEPETVSAGS